MQTEDLLPPSEDNLLRSLGIYQDRTSIMDNGEGYDIIPDPQADQVDLSKLRGVANAEKPPEDKHDSDSDLENLAELVPDIKSRRRSVAGGSVPDEHHIENHPEYAHEGAGTPHGTTGAEGAIEKAGRKGSFASGAESLNARRLSVDHVAKKTPATFDESVRALESRELEDFSKGPSARFDIGENMPLDNDFDQPDEANFDDYPDSEDATDHQHEEIDQEVPKEFINMSSGNSLSTATQTHEVRMPMYLPTFKPATGCTNASDFIVRCFIARLRSGITVVKHGRSRWCKSRLRILHIHPDGRSLSWKPAEGEPSSSKRPPKLDLSTCLEVRHAWSPDPQNPMYTGTPILRQKCEAANAHKSFALIFKHRTVDITAVTADQCKVLMEGFSALCFRLQVATLAGRSGKKGQAMPEEDGASTTASATLTNSSTPRGR